MADSAVQEHEEDSATPSTSNEESEWLDILGSGHLKKRVITKGEDDSRPHRGEVVSIDILCKLEDGKACEKFEGLEISIGDAEVVQGIEYSLPLMNVGETAEIVVSPRFGYGSLGNPPHIPKDATLNYIVTLKEIKNDKEIPSMTVEDRLSVGSKKKERGNWWYQRKEYNLAIQCYRKALTYFECESSESNEEINEARLKTYNNLSVAHFNIEAFDAALTSVNQVLAQEPENIKAIYRKVKILKSLGETEQAITIAKNGLKIKSDSSALQDELNVLIEIKKKSTSAQKVLYRKMFNNAEKKGSKSKRTIISVTWKWLGIITVAAGIIGAAAFKYKY